jgi:glycosyltransferase involved in cell wall biosynthesis
LKHNKIISVIITTKNRLLFLNRAIGSVLDSTLQPDEIIVVNDGGVPIHSSMFIESTIKINVINNDRSYGANFSRNLGFENCTGDIIFFLDDDDAFEPNNIKSIYSLFDNSDVGIGYTGMKIVESDNLHSIKRKAHPKKSNYAKLLGEGNLIGSTSKAAVKREFFDSVDGFDIELKAFQDYDLWLRLSKICETAHDNECNLVYTVHSKGQQISSNYNKYLFSAKLLIAKYSEDAEKYNIEAEMKSHLYLRVAIAASKSSFLMKIKFSLKSFCLKPNIKALALIFIPQIILTKIFPYA